MKKDIEWLKEEVGELPCVDTVFSRGGSSYIDSAVPVMAVYDLLDQLDEPEVLSQEWIDENKSLINGRSTNPDGTEGDCYDAHYIHVLELQNLLVPKLELPVIPKFVAEHIENRRGESLARAYNAPIVTKVGQWLLDKKNCETFARAWLGGYTAEEEPQYIIKTGDERYLSQLSLNYVNNPPVTTVHHSRELAIRFNDRELAQKVANLVNDGKVEELEE